METWTTDNREIWKQQQREKAKNTFEEEGVVGQSKNLTVFPPLDVLAKAKKPKHSSSFTRTSATSNGQVWFQVLSKNLYIFLFFMCETLPSQLQLTDTFWSLNDLPNRKRHSQQPRWKPLSESFSFVSYFFLGSQSTVETETRVWRQIWLFNLSFSPNLPKKDY